MNRMLKKSDGYSLVEVLVAAGIVGLIAIVAGGLVLPIVKLQRHIDTNSGLHMVTSYMRDCVANDEAWRNTVLDKDNTSLDCLRNGTDCKNGETGYIRLRSAGNELCYLNRDTRHTSTDGFTEKGEPCSGFNLTAGTDSCPFHYDVWWIARCPFANETTCPNPLITVAGQMLYSGKDKKAFSQIDLAKFNMAAIRGRADTTRYFALFETKPKGTPGGECKDGGQWRVFSKDQYIDPGNYVRVVMDDGGVVLEPGLYDCHISVPGYLVGGHKAVLMDMGRNVPLLQGTSEYSPGLWGFAQTRSEIYGVISLTEETKVGVMHFCSRTPSTADQKPRTMGVPAGVGLEVYSVFQCSVITRAAK